MYMLKMNCFVSRVNFVLIAFYTKQIVHILMTLFILNN